MFGGAADLVRDVMVGGRWVLRRRRHAGEDAAVAAYKAALKDLLA